VNLQGMSLKAKLEAVIYAAEDPVTLNQLAALFADEALEWRAEQDKATAEARVATPASEPLPFINKGFDYLAIDAETEAAPRSEEAAKSEAAGSQAVTEVAGADAQSETHQAPENAAEESPAEIAGETTESESAEEAPEETARQAARLRDREVRLVIRELLDELIADYADDCRGFEIREIAGGYRMATKPEYHDAVRAFVKSLKPALKLSLPALETLAVIAYKQPVTAPEVNEIRGVDSSGVFGSLLARKLIATAGRKQVVGRPILYKTTKEFLLRFGLKDVSELPSMEEFEKMAASEYEETEAAAADLETSSIEETGAEILDFDDNAALEKEAAPETEGASAAQEAPTDDASQKVEQ
jgi:segregation and condensation protein B